MEIREITDKKIWDSFVQGLPDFTFLQGWNWGEFHRENKERVWRLGAYKEGELVACMLSVSVTARRGSFIFVPHGPLSKTGDISECLKPLLEKLKEIAFSSRYAFIRISPLALANTENKTLFKKFGFRSAPSYMHAEETWILPLVDDENSLLKNMRKTARNLISRAEREGVVITKSRDVKDLAILLELQDKTAERHNFVPFSEKYLRTEFEIFKESDQVLLFLGSHKGLISSAAIIIFYGKRAFYFQSGSVKSEAPVSYLLQWEVIKEAKRRGCELYNLWGVAPEGDSKHQWAGLTTFKSSFGGYRKDYMHAQDLPLSKKYWLSYAIEKLPRTLRVRLRREKKS